MKLINFNKNKFLAIGLMSGTSLDGVDVAIGEYDYGQYRLRFFLTYPYPEDLKHRILQNSSPATSDVQSICGLNVEIAYIYVDAIKEALKQAEIPLEKIAFISSHGQTIWHNPNQKDGHASSTMQIGDANVLSYEFNKPVIYDFRLMDMASGGSGAPLIPIVDRMLFNSEKENILATNIGGIANTTFLGKDGTVLAFDTGPGNMLIDGAMRLLFHKPYDYEGKIASEGKVLNRLLEKLLSDDYFLLPPPKSTGREVYNEKYLQEAIDFGLALEGAKKRDIIATLTEFTAQTIIDQQKRFFPPTSKMLVSGGGSKNKHLMNRLRELFSRSVLTSEELGINSDAKEALGFMILGHLRLLNRPGNVPSATGAKESVCLGSIVLPPKV